MSKRVIVPTPDITKSVELLGELHIESGFPVNSTSWEEIVRSELSSDHRYKTEDSSNGNAFARSAAKIIRSKTISLLAEADYANIKMILGALVKTISLRMATKLEEPSQQLMQIRGAVNAFRMFPTEPAGREVDNIDSAVALAIWTVGMVKAYDDNIKPHFGDGLTRTGKRGLSDEYRWVSGLQEYRSKDFMYLAQEATGTPLAISELIEWNKVFPSEVDAVIDAQNEALKHDNIPVSEKRILEVWPSNLELFWHDLTKLTPACRRLLDAVEQVSGARGDVLILNDRALVSEQQGFMDSLLTVCTNIAGDRRNQDWHEREVAKATRVTWASFANIFRNVEWVCSSVAPDLKNSRVESEIDVLVKSKELMLTIQAKSARSSKSNQREKTTVSEAMKQHRTFRESLKTGAWALARRKSTTDYKIHPRIQDMSEPERVHIPVTVGAETVHLWSVGSSAKDEEFPRVLTTLDHMRVVNFYVPKWFRPVYWADRYAQEFSELKFVDEVDFLGKWIGYLNVNGYPGKLEVVENMVMASSSMVERSLALRNTFSSVVNAGNPITSRALLEDRAQFEYRNFSVAFPRLNEMFEQLLRVSSADCLLLARTILGNTLGGVEEALNLRESSVLRGGSGTVVLQFGSIHPSEVLRLVPDCFLVLSMVSGRWKLSRVAGATSVATSWTLPRFSLPGEAGSPAKYSLE